MERSRKDKRRAVRGGESGTDATIVRTLAFSLISGGGCALLSLVFIAICSLAALSKEDPDGMVSVFGIVIPAISYLLSGFISYKLSRRAPLLCGAVSAVTLMLILKFLSLAFKSSVSSSFGAPIKTVLCVLYAFLAILGAIIAANISLSSNSSKKGGKKQIHSRK